MNNFFNYLLEVNISMILFMLIYWALLRRENQFVFKRIYLLSAILFSLTFPLIHFSYGFSQILIPSVDQVVPTSWLPPVYLNGGEAAGTESKAATGIWEVIKICYLSIAFCLLALFMIRIFNIVSLMLQSEKYKWQNCLVAESHEEKPTFSFFNFIFIGQSHLLNKSEKEEILLHEVVHVKQRHSIDIALIHLVGVACWFNPIIKIYKRNLVLLHEFEADSKSVENKDIEQYCGLLAKVALQKINYPLANHFNHSLTLKRITMMKTMKQKIKTWKMGVMLIATFIAFMIIACQDQMIKTEALTDQQIKDLPPQVSLKLNRLRLESPKSNFQVFIFSPTEADNFIKENPKAYITSWVVVRNDGNSKSYLFVEPNGIFEQLPKNESEVFTQVDEMATPISGMEVYYGNIAETLKYPEEARKKGLEGKVFLEFIIETDGSISDLKVLKGVEESLDTEAMRTIYQLNNQWKPAIHKGKIVRQKIVLPIQFKLG